MNSDIPYVPSLITVQEAARILRCSDRAMRAMIAAGRVPTLRVGARGYAIRIDRDAMLAALRQPARESRQ